MNARDSSPARDGDLGRLPEVLAEDDWQALLSAELGATVRVRYGRARHQVVRVQRQGGVIVVTLSRFFSHAPAEVREALAKWMRSGRRASRAARTLDVWIDQRVRELTHERPVAAKLEPKGRHHDLQALCAQLIAAEFPEAGLRCWPPVGWGRAKGSRSRRSLRLGSYDPVDRLVRLHPVLDSPDVPDWFVRYVLFHELLHAVLDKPAHDGARRVIHGPEFRRRERAYADYARALEWERERIHGLIRAARAEQPFRQERSRARSVPQQREPQRQGWLQRLLF